MTEEPNSLLETVFAEAQHDLDGEAFTARVMARTRTLRYRAAAGWMGVVLALLVGGWLFALPLQEFTVLIAQGLTIPLIELGETWIAWVLSPINNIGSLIVLSVKAFRVGRKKIISASYA